jgi:zinc protease
MEHRVVMRCFCIILWLSSLAFNLEAGYDLETFTLKNGLRVVCLKKKTSPIVSFSIWYRCGSMCDEISKSGVAHYLEHMACEPNKGEFNKFLEAIGAERNAFTSLRTICFYEIVPREHLEDVFRYEALRMVSIDIQDDIFLAEKGAILEERRMVYDSSPEGEAYESTVANAFNRNIGGTSVIGWESEIKDLSPQDLFDFYDKWFAPNNAIILIIGDFTDVMHIKELAEKYFGGIKEKTLQYPEENRTRPAYFKEVVHASPKNGSCNVEYIYHVSPSYGDNIRKNLGLKLLISVLNQPDFFVRKTLEHYMRTASQVNFSYLAKYFQFDIVSFSMGGCSINDNFEEIWNYLRKKLLAAGVKKKDLDVVKRQHQLSLAYRNDDIAQISKHVGRLLSTGYKIEDIQSMDDILQSITPEECNKILQEIFSQKPVVIAKSMPKVYDRD